MKFDQILKFSIIFINFVRAHNKLPTIDKQEVLYMKARPEILEDSAHKTTDIHESGFETFIKPHDYLKGWYSKHCIYYDLLQLTPTQSNSLQLATTLPRLTPNLLPRIKFWAKLTQN